jgi:hypothetical protein
VAPFLGSLKLRETTIAERFIDDPESYIRFTQDPGEIDPTNNPVEQIILSFVVNRRLTQGTRGDHGIKVATAYWSVNRPVKISIDLSTVFLSSAMQQCVKEKLQLQFYLKVKPSTNFPLLSTYYSSMTNGLS